MRVAWQGKELKLSYRSSLLFYSNAGGDCIFATLAGILPHNLFRWASFKNQHKGNEGKGERAGCHRPSGSGKEGIVSRELGLCVNKGFYQVGEVERSG